MKCPYCKRDCGWRVDGDACISAVDSAFTFVKPTHYADYEGGEWLKYTGRAFTVIELIETVAIPAHALRFKHGTIWDKVNGVRA